MWLLEVLTVVSVESEEDRADRNSFGVAQHISAVRLQQCMYTRVNSFMNSISRRSQAVNCSPRFPFPTKYPLCSVPVFLSLFRSSTCFDVSVSVH